MPCLNVQPEGLHSSRRLQYGVGTWFKRLKFAVASLTLQSWYLSIRMHRNLGNFASVFYCTWPASATFHCGHQRHSSDDVSDSVADPAAEADDDYAALAVMTLV